jgi:hypothetical protein
VLLKQNKITTPPKPMAFWLSSTPGGYFLCFKNANKAYTTLIWLAELFDQALADQNTFSDALISEPF